MNSLSRTVTTALTVNGPAGQLEALLEAPETSQVAQLAVVCHPHPLYGGTMTNKVVHMLARSFNEFGAASIRFNYRGVGASAGGYDEGNGETDDTLAVLDWAALRWPLAELWLGGFSFGGAVAIRASVQRNVQRLITVAPAINRVNVEAEKLPQCPWLLVQGDHDEVVDLADITRWIATLRRAPELALLPGAEHFFHGRLNELREVVVQWLRRNPTSNIETTDGP